MPENICKGKIYKILNIIGLRKFPNEFKFQDGLFFQHLERKIQQLYEIIFLLEKREEISLYENTYLFSFINNYSLF